MCSPRSTDGKARRFLPFMEGPRSCAGQALAVMNLTATLAALYGNFTFKLADEVSASPKTCLHSQLCRLTRTQDMHRPRRAAELYGGFTFRLAEKDRRFPDELLPAGSPSDTMEPLASTQTCRQASGQTQMRYKRKRGRRSESVSGWVQMGGPEGVRAAEHLSITMSCDKGMKMHVVPRV